MEAAAFASAIFSPVFFSFAFTKESAARQFSNYEFPCACRRVQSTTPLLLCIRGTVCRGLRGFLPGLLTRGTGDSFTSPLTQHLHGDGTTGTSATRQDGCQKPTRSAPGEAKSLLVIARGDFCGKDEKSCERPLPCSQIFMFRADFPRGFIWAHHPHRDQ